MTPMVPLVSNLDVLFLRYKLPNPYYLRLRHNIRVNILRPATKTPVYILNPATKSQGIHSECVRPTRQIAGAGSAWLVSVSCWRPGPASQL